MLPSDRPLCQRACVCVCARAWAPSLPPLCRVHVPLEHAQDLRPPRQQFIGGHRRALGLRPLEGAAAPSVHLTRASAQLEHGAHAGPINQEDGRSALHAASAAGHADVVARLLDADGADSTLRDGAGLTAAEVAQQAAHLDVVRVFAEHAANELKKELVAARQLARGGS